MSSMERVVRHRVGEYADFIGGAVWIPVVIALLAVGVAAFAFVLAWYVAGAVTWLVGWPVSAFSRGSGRQVRDAGARLLAADPSHRLAESARELAHPRQTKERQRAAAEAARAAAEAPARAKLAAAEAQAQAERTQAEALAQIEAMRAWAQGPPPTLYVPRRFSEDWFANNVPKLHPGQVPALLEELRARGWTDQRIQQRLPRYLALNQFWPAE
jgi:hypothetical protein